MKALKYWGIIFLKSCDFFLLIKELFLYICGRIAGVAQLVERQPSKLNVAGSNPVSRSKKSLSFDKDFFILKYSVLFQVRLHRAVYFVQKYEQIKVLLKR